MNTNKKKASSFQAGTFSNEDIRALREFVDSLDALTQEEPQGTLTPEEWDEAMKEINRTGKIPAKYRGRIAENEVTVYSDIVDGKHKHFPDGIKKKAYYDIADEAHNRKITSLDEMFQE